MTLEELITDDRTRGLLLDLFRYRGWIYAAEGNHMDDVSEIVEALYDRVRHTTEVEIEEEHT